MKSEFIDLKDIDETILTDVQYSYDDNFVGNALPGYNSQKIICTKEAAHKLKTAHELAKQKGYRFLVYDAYRPQKCVDYFKEWSLNSCEKMKDHYYPLMDKPTIIKTGYIAISRSTHSRGSTFDLTLIENDKLNHSKKPAKRHFRNGDQFYYLNDGSIDMGSSFDLFHSASHHDTDLVSDEQNNNREILREIMLKSGFNDFAKEWWHYTMKDEPFPEDYFDFDIE